MSNWVIENNSIVDCNRGILERFRDPPDHRSCYDPQPFASNAFPVDGIEGCKVLIGGLPNVSPGLAFLLENVAREASITDLSRGRGPRGGVSAEPLVLHLFFCTVDE